MAQYRKKPVVVEAMKWNGLHASGCMGDPDKFEKQVIADAEHMEEISDFMAHGDQVLAWRGDKIEIDTLEGTMTADPGDWIIKEPFATKDRQFYPCKPDIFEATYEPVEAG